MRKITQQEANAWTALAKEHGFVDEDGKIALGRFVVEPSSDPSQIRLRFVTPVIAGEHAEDLTPKTPPIMFDRAVNGDIILPGRWWQNMFERFADSGVSEEDRRTAKVMSHSAVVDDILLPADTDTIQMIAPNHAGELVVHEAIKPGTVGLLRIVRA